MRINDILTHPRFQSAKTRFENYTDHRGANECWPWTSQTTTDGYGRFSFMSTMFGAHRVAWVLVNGPVPAAINGHPTYVCHTCDNPVCCNPKHLFLGNHRINTADMVAKRRHVYGSRSKSAKLTETDIEFILDSRLSHGELAQKFGVVYRIIEDIRHRKTWVHVRPGEPANPAYREKSKPKLTAETALAVFHDRRVRSKVAADYGISRDHVRDIQRGYHWSHITGAVRRKK